MNKDSVIGLIYRFDHNDYQLSLMDFEKANQELLQKIFMKYANDCSCIRGNKDISINDANIEHWEID